ncbi:MAG: hypothetical protein C0200_00985 [Thermoproteota archaeon]|nr:MAG: hypothetical protein C0200_00985 [Candidatus Korarchaeota archaeon]
MLKKRLAMALVFLISSFFLWFELLTPVRITLGGLPQPICLEFFTPESVLIILISAMALVSSGLLFILEESRIDLISRKKALNMLEDRERIIYETILSAGGMIRQKDLVAYSGMSEAAVSRYLYLLEAKGLIRRKKKGKENIIVLSNSYII